MNASQYCSRIVLLLSIVFLAPCRSQEESSTNSRFPHIRLCCRLGYSYYPANSCRPARLDHTPQLPVYDAFLDRWQSRVEILQAFELAIGQPECSIDLGLVPPESHWLLRSDGTILYQDDIVLNQSKYCLSANRANDSREALVTLFACLDVPRPINYLAYCMLASVPFLLITLIVYAWLPELRTLHGMALMCYLLGLAGMFVGMALVQLEYGAKARLCAVLGPLTYFLIMFTFVWLNVISFDLWWNFRGSGKLRASSKREQRRTFAWFSAYAWLTSLALVAVSMLADWSDRMPNWLQPGFTRMAMNGSCFLKNDKISKFLYLYMPIVLIMSCNATFFLLTARQIRRRQQEIGSVVSGSSDSGRHQKRLVNEQQEQFAMFGRLYIIMGVTWVLDVVSWSLDGTTALVFQPSDLCNALQGPIIFGLFVLKPNVRRMIAKKCGCCGSILSGLMRLTSRSSTATAASTVEYEHDTS